MRKLPDAKSEKIAALPCGTKVTVQANIGVIVAHEVEEFKDFKVKGVWLLVKYGDKVGFVFDGYMSRLVAPEKENFLTNFKKQGKEKDGINAENRKISVQHYDKGLITETFIGEQFGITTYLIKEISFYEGYIILKKSFPQLFEKPDIFKFENKEIHIEKYFEEGGSGWGSIKKVKNEIKIVIGGGC